MSRDPFKYFSSLPLNDGITLPMAASLTPSIGDLTTTLGQRHQAANLVKQFMVTLIIRMSCHDDCAEDVNPNVGLGGGGYSGRKRND
jgi:hypothetical protein